MSGRPVGFIHDWKPHDKTLALIEAAKAVLNEYAAYGPMTLRQVFYRLVGTMGYEKTERAYKVLGETLQKARRARYIPFSAIRDDGDTIVKPDGWESVAQLMGSISYTVDTFRLYPDIGQPVRIMVLVEAGGMVPMVARMVSAYGITVRSAGGFDGVTSKHALAENIAEHYADCDRPTIILHCGDYDPSGEHIFLNLEKDVSAFLDDLSDPEAVEFERVLLTPQQISAYRLPTAPAKATDNRSFYGIDGDPDATVQAEALNPADLETIIVAAIERHWDKDIAETLREREKHAKAELHDWLRNSPRP
jgi:hypothetical protein